MHYILKTDWRKKTPQIRKPKWTHIVNKELHTLPKNKPPKNYEHASNMLIYLKIKESHNLALTTKYG